MVKRYLICSTASLVAFLSLSNVARATDEIICTSKQFHVSLAVATDGYVASMVLSNSSQEIFSEIFEVSNLEKRKVSISQQLVDVEATLVGAKVNKVKIQLKHGKGYISVDSHKEKMRCDWLV